MSAPGASAGERRRRYRRRTLRVRVRLLWPGGALEDWATTLGAGGMYVPCESPLPKGSVLTAHFRLGPACTEHSIRSRVAWSLHDDSPGMGLTFEDPVARSRLARDLALREDARNEGE